MTFLPSFAPRFSSGLRITPNAVHSAGSKNRQKDRERLARAHEKAAASRRGYSFKLAHELTERYDLLAFEDLNLRGMQRLWKVVEDSPAHGREEGKRSEVDHLLPSSTTFDCTLYISGSLSKSEREWDRVQCGERLTRDVNAVVNIIHVGASTCGGGDRRPALALAFASDPTTPRL